MNSSDSDQPGDEAVNHLLTRQYSDTSADFEARWVSLKRDLRTGAAPTPRTAATINRRRGLAWFGPITALAAVAIMLLAGRRGPSIDAVPVISPQLAELFAMDAALNRAAPLLGEEQRLVLLNLSPQSTTSNAN